MEESNRVRIKDCLASHNFRFKDAELTMKELSVMVFKELSESRAYSKLLAMNRGSESQMGTVLPMHYRRICNILECDMNELFQEDQI